MRFSIVACSSMVRFSFVSSGKEACWLYLKNLLYLSSSLRLSS